MLEQADRDGRAGDDHRAPRVRHRLDERALASLSCSVSSSRKRKTDEQRVVDRDAEADERDEELDDDRDVREVRQPRRRSRNVVRIDVIATTIGIATAGERAEDEDQHDERAGAAEESLGEDARAPVGALRLEDRVAAGEVHRRRPAASPRFSAARTSSIGGSRREASRSPADRASRTSCAGPSRGRRRCCAVEPGADAQPGPLICARRRRSPR